MIKIMFMLCVLSLSPAVSAKPAQEVGALSKMEAIDAAETRADFAELQVLEQQAAPIRARLQARLARYRLELEQFRKSWGINFETREIQRVGGAR